MHSNLTIVMLFQKREQPFKIKAGTFVENRVSRSELCDARFFFASKKSGLVHFPHQLFYNECSYKSNHSDVAALKTAVECYMCTALFEC